MSSQSSIKRRTLVKKCLKCGGKGFVFEYTLDSSYRYVHVKKQCQKCYGKGVLW